MQNKGSLREVWDSIEDQNSEHNEIQQKNWKKINREIQRSTLKKVFLGLSIVAIFIFGFWLLPNKNLVESKTEYLATGQEKQVVLKDGTEIKLFDGSRLIVENHFNEKERRVSLFGKAEFKVTRSTDKKFIVQSKTIDVSVLGTTFLVDNKSEKNRVELFEGKVRIHDKQTDESAILSPQQVWEKYKYGTSKMFYFKTKELHFSFNNDDFNKAIKEVSDSYNVKISFPESLKDKKITGGFTGDLETILKIASYPFHLKVEKKNEEYRLK